MTLADLRDGVPIGFEIWLTLGCITELSVAMLGISLLFQGTPQLTSMKALARYLVVGVILAPLVAGLVGAIPSVPGGYWMQWRLWFFGDALAFLTLTPAILTWFRAGRAWTHKPQNCLELACLMSLLVLFGYLTFIAAGQRQQPALLYSLVPLLLWAALRLGLKGVSTSIVVVALLSIWGAAHGRGPFADQGPLNSILSLQLFLFFAAMPFMFLAVLVEGEKHAEGALRKSEEKFSQAFRESPIALSLSSIKDHRYIEVNETFEHRTGWRRDEVIGRTPLDIGLWTDSVQRDDFQRRLLNEGRVRNFEICNRTKNGEVRTGLGSAELIEIDGQPCALTAVADITDLKQAEAALRESEARFRLVANTAPVMIWMTGVDKLCTYVNQPCVEFTEQPAEAQLGNGWTEGIHSDDLAQSWNTYSEAFDHHEPFRMEYRFRRHDGEYRWILASGVPRFDADGSFAGYIGSAVDVTDRKLAEEALSRVGRRLIEAHEEERTWLARELHDDINQRIALLSLALKRLNQDLPASAAEASHRIEEVCNQVVSLGDDVQALSHRLHSSNLDYLGLRTAAAGFCREFSDQYRVEVEFCSEEVPKNLPKEISLCLFRVLQEALQNATKHSGSKHVLVALACDRDSVTLTVADSGIGFDPEQILKERGIGLISMKERLKLVNGDLYIDSQLQRGTTIRARVPLKMTRAANS